VAVRGHLKEVRGVQDRTWTKSEGGEENKRLETLDVIEVNGLKYQETEGKTGENVLSLMGHNRQFPDIKTSTTAEVMCKQDNNPKQRSCSLTSKGDCQ
jgi:hypothetical protein